MENNWNMGIVCNLIFSAFWHVAEDADGIFPVSGNGRLLPAASVGAPLLFDRLKLTGSTACPSTQSANTHP
jgi:hypothetical protein